MTAFLCAAALMVVAVTGILAFALLRRPAADGGSHSDENLRLLRLEYARLKSEREAGRLSEEAFEEQRAELEMRVLDEQRGDEEPRPGRGRGAWLAFLTMVLVPVAAGALYIQLGTPQAMDPQFVAAHSARAEGRGHSDAEMFAQVSRLEERLRRNPDNADGWLMLARTRAAFRQWRESAAAYEQLDRLVPGNPTVLADWADVLASANGGSLEGRPRELIEKALKLDPGHLKALALMGTYCFNKQDYRGAAAQWERMRAEVEPGSEVWRDITENIEEARRLGGLPPAEKGVMKEVTPPAPAKAAPAGHFVEGRVEVAPALASGIRPTDTVFVFARPVSGGRMPVAFVRVKASELPAAFRLDASNQMGMGTRTLQDFSEVIVEARVSRTGNFMPARGDAEGRAEGVVRTGSDSVRIVIDRVLE